MKALEAGNCNIKKRRKRIVDHNCLIHHEVCLNKIANFVGILMYTHLASRASANTPAASGAAAEVPL